MLARSDLSWSIEGRVRLPDDGLQVMRKTPGRLWNSLFRLLQVLCPAAAEFSGAGVKKALVRKDQAIARFIPGLSGAARSAR
jgi:hypothetical protein